MNPDPNGFSSAPNCPQRKVREHGTTDQAPCMPRPLHAIPASGGRELSLAPRPCHQWRAEAVVILTREQPVPLFHGVSQCHISFCLLVRVLPLESDPGQSSNQLQDEAAISHTQVSAPPTERRQDAQSASQNSQRRQVTS